MRKDPFYSGKLCVETGNVKFLSDWLKEDALRVQLDGLNLTGSDQVFGKS